MTLFTEGTGCKQVYVDTAYTYFIILLIVILFGRFDDVVVGVLGC